MKKLLTLLLLVTASFVGLAQVPLTMDMTVQRIPVNTDTLSQTSVTKERVTIVFIRTDRIILLTALDSLELRKEPFKVVFPLENVWEEPDKEGDIFVDVNSGQHYSVTRRRFHKHKFFYSFSVVPPFVGDNLHHILVEPVVAQ